VAFKFEKLEVWELALEYVDLAYQMREAYGFAEKLFAKLQALRHALK
jgi:hypothetical protein